MKNITLSSAELTGRVVISTNLAKNGRSKLDDKMLSYTGMSSPKIRHFLNNICSFPLTNYLEVGLATGSTMLSALWKNEHVVSYGADLWLESKNDKTGEEDFKRNYAEILGTMRTKLYSGDCFKMLKQPGFFEDKINVFLYDGGHSVEDHALALTYFEPILAQNFVMIIDDWNDDRVQKGTVLGLKKSNFRVIYEQFAPAKIGSTPPHWGDMNEWWNGIAMLVMEKV